MELNDKSFTCAGGGVFQRYPADLCIMVLLRLLSYPCRVFDMVDIFGIKSNRLCEMYHAAVEYIHARYHKLCDPNTWTQFFPVFADIMHCYRCPYPGRTMLGCWMALLPVRVVLADWEISQLISRSIRACFIEVQKQDMVTKCDNEVQLRAFEVQ